MIKTFIADGANAINLITANAASEIAPICTLPVDSWAVLAMKLGPNLIINNSILLLHL
ncbi:hypothetical protein [Dyadobacter sp. CY356]|uniref:hypothetical protein n=1 Tax=Dyadobacter sp. CY356 TaxID=2906442 RepID=UPI001F21AAEA|nr:hypothetical protein [Dyadobacter sp. CY356]MCF0055285.1 hypothetical protein [Dyadobacter sp. CY356]